MPIIHLHTYRLLKQILEQADKVVIVSVNTRGWEANDIHVCET